MLIKNMSPNTTLVFFPGFLGFYKYGFSSLVISYFRNLEGILRDEGVEFLFPSPPQTGSVAERAESLSFAIKERTKGKLILIGHSMGGLDGRFLIHHLDPDHRVRALFTLSTPHHGTPVAPWILDTDGPFQFMVRSFGAKALREMTPDACRKRNQEITNRQDVSYISYAGKRELRDIPIFLRALGKIVEKVDGENDGLVAVSSAQWGDYRGTVPADHLELVGWSLAPPNPRIQRPFPHIQFFGKILTEVLGSERS